MKIFRENLLIVNNLDSADLKRSYIIIRQQTYRQKEKIIIKQLYFVKQTLFYGVYYITGVPEYKSSVQDGTYLHTNQLKGDKHDHEEKKTVV